MEIKSICLIFHGDNIKYGESKRKSHVLELHGAHHFCTKINRYHMWSWCPSCQDPSFATQHTDPPHGSGFLQLRKANQNQDEKCPHHLLLSAREKSTRIYGFSAYLGMKLCFPAAETAWVRQTTLVACPSSLIIQGLERTSSAERDAGYPHK